MELTPEILADFLETLREQGVSSFTSPLFSVVLGPLPQDEGDQEDLRSVARAVKEPVAKGIYGHPSLWPDGQPARFPGSKQ